MGSSAVKQKDPCFSSIDGHVAELPRNRLSVSSSDLKDSFSRISFTGFWFADGIFKSWAMKMEALHEPTWRKAGIFEAIKTSTYTIPKNQSLILALVQKWCPETKSFVFPWGEATITLEDVLVLLGFSVLGSPVFAPLESSEMRDAVEKLDELRIEILKSLKSKNGRVSQPQWISTIENRDDSLEHEAFLALWLSHFVFPDKSRRSVSRNVLPLAVRLARGERIALAPPVLASLYRDLGQIQAFATQKSTENVNLKSLFKLVQVWAWERFRITTPLARKIPKGEPRIARWDNLSDTQTLSFDDFDWRPYTKPIENWNPPRFYVEEAMWVTVDYNLNDEFVSFARCLRVSQLVGIGFVEDYYPNRVAMQFGLTQDLPGLVADHRNFTEKEAWDHYNKSLDGLKLYVPSRLATAATTARYRDWWMKSVSEFLGSSERTETSKANKRADRYDDEDDVLPLGQVLQALGDSFFKKLRSCKRPRSAKNLRLRTKKDKSGDGCASAATEFPLGQLFNKELAKSRSEHLRKIGCKRARDADESSKDYKDDEEEEDDDNITISQMIKFRRNQESGSKAEKRMVLRVSNENNSSDPHIDIVVSAPETRQICDDVLHVKEEKRLLHEDVEKQRYNEKLCSEEEAEKERDIVERLKQRKLTIKEIALKLEARIMEVEKSLAIIKR